ncbi:P-loop containing nucleoside triphosphate hydrolase protein [Phlyctochytrium arcticum]|nr:P-loop containing nucleoside triphosphate hydrolase protein [Phlyctochytrium arcticum]
MGDEVVEDAPVEDMTTLSDLSENAIMINLKRRYDERLIYTYTGSILVALNPFEKLDIYNLPLLKKYLNKRHADNPPHIFAIAETAYANVRTARVNQSVIISGESGAGKSESTKVILQYLTTVTSKESQESWVEQQILEANTVLESFGNAKTVRNNNSSRFGKFIQINFNRSSQIIGASILNYLLEKSRISKQAPDERNYHVFYELVAGTNDEEKAAFKLESADSFYYLNQSGCIDIPYVDDSKNFEALKLALTVLKMSPADQNSLFQALSAILWIGNINFDEAANKESVKIQNVEDLEVVAGLLGINVENLKAAMCYRKLVIRGETSMVPYKLGQAKDTRDSFAKAIYDSLFVRLIEFINRSLTSKEKPVNFVGVLDIFGFEVFKLNSFEQFCINYTNEKLQQFFNQFIFKIEQEEYDKEGIKWDKISFQDNAACLDLIEVKPAGILSLLDEETRFPKGSDDSWLAKLETAHQKHAHYIKPKTQKGVFGIKHYAGDVLYTVSSFLDKNKDAIQEELYELVRASKIPYISKIFPKEVQEDSSKTQRGGKPTAGAQFRNSLTLLVTTLGATTPHYVRCIKPNQDKEAFLFDEDMVISQLRYSGMLDTIRIRKAGYPMRLSYDGFARDFKCLIPSGMVLTKTNAKEISSAIAAETNMVDGAWQAGKTKLFLKEGALGTIQDRAGQVLRAKVILIQSRMLGYLYRKRFLRLREATSTIQRFAKGFVYKRRYKRTQRAILKIQSVARGWFVRDYYRRLLADKKAAEKKAFDSRAAASAAAALEAEKQREERKMLDTVRPESLPPAPMIPADVLAPRVSVKEVAPPPSPVKVMPPSREENEKMISFANAVHAKKESAPSATPSDLAMATSPTKKDGGDIDHLFAFLGDFDPSKAIKGGEALVRMAAALTADIDALFDDRRPIATTSDKRPVGTTSGSTPMLTSQSSHGLPSLAARTSVTNMLSTPVVEPVSSKKQTLAERLESAVRTPTPKQSMENLHYSRESLAQAPVKPMKHNPILKEKEASIESLVEKIDYTTREYAMESYAEKHFEQHIKTTAFATITKKVKMVDLSEMLSYTKNAIPASMTKIPHKTEAIDQLAVDCFRLLQKATEPGAKKSEEFVQQFVGHGLRNAELRDELFVQIVKQSTPSKEQPKAWDQVLISHWQVLVHAAASFPPSKVFAKYLMGYLHRTMDTYHAKNSHHAIYRLAQTAEASVKRVMLNGPRKVAPSIAEIMTLRAGAALPCRVSLLDGLEMDITISLTSTAGDIVKNIAETIQLQDASGWSIYEVTLRNERSLKATDYLVDCIASWEKDKDTPKRKDTVGTIRKKKGEPVVAPGICLDATFTMKKRVFRNTQEPITDPVEYALLYAQAVDGVAKDLYPLTERVAMQMAALKAQVILGNCDAAAAEARFVKELSSWVAPRLVPNQPREAWVQGIVKQYQKLRGTTTEQAKVLYLESVKTFKHYGAALFPVKHKGSWTYSETINLAVSNAGIDFVHPRTNDTILSFPFKDVKSYEHENGLVTIMAVPVSEEADFENTEVYQFFTDLAEEIVNLIREYCPSTEYMKRAKDTNVHNVDLASLIRDVEKYRSALVEHKVMRIPGPDSKRAKWAPLRKLVNSGRTMRSPISPLSPYADSTGNLNRRGSVSSRHDEEKPEDGVFPSGDDMSPGIINTENYTIADWSFSPKPLSTSLLGVADNELEMWATEASGLLLSFLGSAGSPAPEVATFNCAGLQATLEKALESPMMANELYLQLIKQTSNHPDADCPQVLNMWKIFAIISGVIIPTQWVAEYAKAHLRRGSVVDPKARKPRTEEAQHARHCLRILHRTIGAGARKYPPSTDEIAQSAKLTPLRIRFHLMDGQSKAIPIEPSDTCDVVHAALLDKLKLQNLHGFAIYEQFMNQQIALGKDEKLTDALFRWERVAKEQNSQERVRFVFKKRIFLNPSEPCKSEAEETLVRAQGLADLAAGRFPATRDEAINMASLAVQAHFGDVNYDAPVNYQQLCAVHIPYHYRQPGIEKQLEEKHMEFLGMSAVQASQEISNLLRSWPYYGCTIFEVGQNYSKDIPSACWLAISPSALHIFARHAKAPIISHPFEDVVSFSPSYTSLLLITGSQTAGSKYVFSTPQAAELAALIREYINLSKGNATPLVRMDKSRGSNFALSGDKGRKH